MTFQHEHVPHKSDRLPSMVPPAIQPITLERYPELLTGQSTLQTCPWAVASFALAILALLAPIANAAVAPTISFAASALSILCGAIALAVILYRRTATGLWMSLLSIGASALSLIFAALVVFAS